MYRLRKPLSLILVLMLTLLLFSCSIQNKEVRLIVNIKNPPVGVEVLSASGEKPILDREDNYVFTFSASRRVTISISCKGYNTRTLIVESDDFIDGECFVSTELSKNDEASISLNITNSNLEKTVVRAGDIVFSRDNSTFRASLDKSIDHILSIECEGYVTRFLNIISDEIEKGYKSYSIILARTGMTLIEFEFSKGYSNIVPRATILHTLEEISLYYLGSNEHNYKFYFEAPLNTKVRLHFYATLGADKDIVIEETETYPQKIFLEGAEIEWLQRGYVPITVVADYTESEFFYSLDGKRYRAYAVGYSYVNFENAVSLFVPKGAVVMEAYYNHSYYVYDGLDTFGKIAVRYTKMPITDSHRMAFLDRNMFTDWEIYSNYIRVFDAYEERFLDTFSTNQEVFTAVNEDYIAVSDALEATDGITQEQANSFTLQELTDYHFCLGSHERNLDFLLSEQNISRDGRKGEGSYIILYVFKKLDFDYRVLDSNQEELTRVDSLIQMDGNYYSDSLNEVRVTAYYQGGERKTSSYYIKTLERTFLGWHGQTASISAYFFTDEIENGRYGYDIYHRAPLEFEILPYDASTGNLIALSTGGFLDFTTVFLSDITGTAYTLGDLKIKFLPDSSCTVHLLIERYSIIDPELKPSILNLSAKNITFDYSMLERGYLRIDFTFLNETT